MKLWYLRRNGRCCGYFQEVGGRIYSATLRNLLLLVEKRIAAGVSNISGRVGGVA